MGEEEGKRRRIEERQGSFMCRKQGKAVRAHSQWQVFYYEINLTRNRDTGSCILETQTPEL